MNVKIFKHEKTNYVSFQIVNESSEEQFIQINGYGGVEKTFTISPFSMYITAVFYIPVEVKYINYKDTKDTNDTKHIKSVKKTIFSDDEE